MCRIYHLDFHPKKKKSLCFAREEEGCGKGSTGINYLQGNLLFQHRTEKASVPAPPVIRAVLFFFLLCLLFFSVEYFLLPFPLFSDELHLSFSFCFGHLFLRRKKSLCHLLSCIFELEVTLSVLCDGNSIPSSAEV